MSRIYNTNNEHASARSASARPDAGNISNSVSKTAHVEKLASDFSSMMRGKELDRQEEVSNKLSSERFAISHEQAQGASAAQPELLNARHNKMQDNSASVSHPVVSQGPTTASNNPGMDNAAASNTQATQSQQAQATLMQTQALSKTLFTEIQQQAFKNSGENSFTVSIQTPNGDTATVIARMDSSGNWKVALKDFDDAGNSAVQASGHQLQKSMDKLAFDQIDFQTLTVDLESHMKNNLSTVAVQKT